MKLKFEIEMFEKSKFSLITFCIIVIAIVVVVFAFFVVKNGFIPADDSQNTTLILSFVGILATFIIVSNYAHLKTIEKKSEKINDDLQKKIQGVKDELYSDVALEFSFIYLDKKHYYDAFYLALSLAEKIESKAVADELIKTLSYHLTDVVKDDFLSVGYEPLFDTVIRLEKKGFNVEKIKKYMTVSASPNS